MSKLEKFLRNIDKTWFIVLFVALSYIIGIVAYLILPPPYFVIVFGMMMVSYFLLGRISAFKEIYDKSEGKENDKN